MPLVGKWLEGWRGKIEYREDKRKGQKMNGIQKRENKTIDIEFNFFYESSFQGSK